jgi:hypothetical protein
LLFYDPAINGIVISGPEWRRNMKEIVVPRVPKPSGVTPAPRSSKTKTKTKTVPASPQVTPDEISRRAYEIYLSRGPAEGGPLEDWLRAERELLDSTDAQTA